MAVSKSTASGKAPSDRVPFEEAYAELESIVQRLNTQLPLEEQVALYERGTQLLKDCREALDAARIKLKTISPADMP